MYTLLSGLYKYLTRQDEYSILILGLDNAGKTAKADFIAGYKPLPLDRITTTVGLNVGNVTVDNLLLKFWDLGGQTELQALWDKYYSEAHGILFLVDSNDSTRFNESKEAFVKMIKNPHLENVPLLILFNKHDLAGSSSMTVLKQLFDENSPLLSNRDCSIQYVSALTGYGVKDSIGWIRDKVVKNAFHRPPTHQDI